MTESLRALTTGLFDYAGLFPPAALPLPEALTCDRTQHAGEEAWMLGRFVCPAAQLAAAAANPPRAISVLAAASLSPQAFLPTLEQTLAHAAAAQPLAHWVLDQVEIPVPSGVAGADLATAHARCTAAGLRAFFETPRGETGHFPRLAELGAGLKIRCGGLKAEAFPTCAELAAALMAAETHALPLKFTAGLHHPLRRFDAGVQTTMHGFVNVYAAAMLGAALNLDAAARAAILACEEATAFGFGDDGLRFGPHFISSSSLRHLRATRFHAYGTCSIAEPLEDLRALGWL